MFKCTFKPAQILVSLAVILIFIDRQAGVYGSIDTTVLHLLSLCYARKKSDLDLKGEEKNHGPVKERLYIGSCTLEKGNPEQIGIMKPVKSHRRLLTSSSNPKGFTRNRVCFWTYIEVLS